MTDILDELRSIHEQGLSELEGRLRTPVKVNSEPLTYHRNAPVSYFADLIASSLHQDRGAAQRLERHDQESRIIAKERQERAWRGLRAGQFEYRIEPNTADGEGGYFTVPAWLNELFATAKRPGRVLAGLIPGRFPLPNGISSVNVPIFTQGTLVKTRPDNTAVADQDITDSAGTSFVATLDGEADVALQLLEQSPAGAALDWVVFKDLAEAYDFELESQLIAGLGTAQRILGVTNVASTVGVTYTSASPTGTTMFPYIGQAVARVGNNRDLQPEVILMRTARWAWIGSQEDTAGLPFSIASPFFMGSDPLTPDPVGGMLGLPAFLDDAIPSTIGGTASTAGTQDEIIVLRPSDLLLFEGMPQTAVMRDPLSGSLGVRLQLHNRAAAITNRYPSGISPVTGTGMVVQSGYNN